jgi:acetyl-CoA acetyltransferase
MNTFKDKAAIVGVGRVPFSLDSQNTEMGMACLAIKAALDDAGLTPDSIDGFIEYAEEDFDEILVARSMGIGNLTYHGDVRWDGGAACAMIQRAAMAVASAMAGTVVVVRAVNDASLNRQKKTWSDPRSWVMLEETFYNPCGLTTDEGRVGMMVQRYIAEHKINPDDIGWATVVARENGARNPNSLFHESTVSIEEYKDSSPTVSPFRRMDIPPAVDGAIAFIVTSDERAKRLKSQPVYITAATQSIVRGTQFKTGYYRDSITDIPGIKNVGQRLYEESGLSPKEIDAVQIEDSFAALVPMQLEALGFCEPGTGVDYINNGDRIRSDGETPVNTSGGSIGEGCLHGINHIAEAVFQLRGSSTAQVENANHVLVATGACGPASGLILRR